MNNATQHTESGIIAPPLMPVPIILMAALMAMGPLAVDAYLPALPKIAETYGVSIHSVELTLSFYLAGFAVGQLVGGPFSDHFGRRLSTFVGMGLFAIGSLGVMLSPNIEGLWLFRLVQALGGGLAVINPAAVIRDLSSGIESARNMAHMAIIMMMAPLLAPFIGSFILYLSQWQSIFLFLLMYCLIITAIIYFRLPETRVLQETRPKAWTRYWQVLSHRHSLGYIFAQSFAFAGMFAFVTASPQIYMNFFGVSQTQYSFLFAGNVLGLMVFNRINVRLLRYFSPLNILRAGQAAQIIICLLFVLYVNLTSDMQLSIVVTLIVLSMATGAFIASNASANTIEYFPTNSGTATALLGAASFLTGSLSGAVVGLIGDGTPIPMAGVMLGCAVAGMLLRVGFQLGKDPNAKSTH